MSRCVWRWRGASSHVGQFLGLISILVDLSQRPDEARPLVCFRNADLLQEDRRMSAEDVGGEIKKTTDITQK